MYNKIDAPLLLDLVKDINIVTNNHPATRLKIYLIWLLEHFNQSSFIALHLLFSNQSWFSKPIAVRQPFEHIRDNFISQNKAHTEIKLAATKQERLKEVIHRLIENIEHRVVSCCFFSGSNQKIQDLKQLYQSVYEKTSYDPNDLRHLTRIVNQKRHCWNFWTAPKSQTELENLRHEYSI